jgi:hypothetical protein
MLHKRGLSPSELEELDPELFEYLMIFDSVIEPNGAKFEQIKYANLCHLILMSSGNLTEQGMKKAKVLDWDMFGLLSNLTTRELAEEQEKDKCNQEQATFSAMADLIKSEALAKNKGKGDGKK